MCVCVCIYIYIYGEKFKNKVMQIFLDYFVSQYFSIYFSKPFTPAPTTRAIFNRSLTSLNFEFSVFFLLNWFPF